MALPRPLRAGRNRGQITQESRSSVRRIAVECAGIRSRQCCAPHHAPPADHRPLARITIAPCRRASVQELSERCGRVESVGRVRFSPAVRGHVAPPPNPASPEVNHINGLRLFFTHCQAVWPLSCARVPGRDVVEEVAHGARIRLVNRRAVPASTRPLPAHGERCRRAIHELSCSCARAAALQGELRARIGARRPAVPGRFARVPPRRRPPVAAGMSAARRPRAHPDAVARPSGSCLGSRRSRRPRCRQSRRPRSSARSRRARAPGSG